MLKKLLTLSLLLLLLAGSADAKTFPGLLSRNLKENQIPLSKIKAQRKGKMHTAGKTINSANKIRMKAAPGTTEVFGYLGYSESDDFAAGLYKIENPGLSLIWDDPIYADATISLQTGWKNGDRICGFIPYYYLGELITIIYIELDAKTGYPLAFVDQDAVEGAFEIATLNPADNHIYGYGYDDKGNWLFMKAPAETPFSTVPIKYLSKQEEGQICSAFTYSEKDKIFYGVNADNQFVRIAPNGNQTSVMALSPYIQPYVSGLCHSASENIFYWNATLRKPGNLDDVSYLYTIDPEEKKSTEIDEYEYCEQFMFFITSGDSFPADAPAMPTFISSDFATGAPSGSVVFKLPALTEGGSSITTNVTWHAYLDGKEYENGENAPGENITLTFESLAPGTHLITVQPVTAGISGQSASCTIFIGNDTPSTPQNVELSVSKISWSPVTTGSNGGYIDPSKIIYNVYLNGAKEATTSDTNVDINISTDLPLRKYSAYVEACFGDLISKPGYSNTIVVGKPLQLDVSLTPTAEQANLMTVEDVNKDGYTWSYDPYNSALFSDYSENGPADDWVFLPVTYFPESENLICFTMQAMAASEEYPLESVEVKFGNEARSEAMTTEVIGRFTPLAGAFQTYSGYFNANGPIEGYIGIHACSAPDQYGIYVRDLNILTTDVSIYSPGFVSDLKATAAPGGAAKANVSFKMPLNTYAGQPLDKEEILTAHVICKKISKDVTGKPGETVTAEIETGQGSNTIDVYVSYKNLDGPASSVKVYTGEDVPATVNNLVAIADPDMMGMTLTWEAPTEGFNGGYIDPQKLTYQIYRYISSNSGSGWQPIGETSDCSFNFRCEKGAEQDLVNIGVLASNSKGDSGRVKSVSELLGTPYPLPMLEKFNGGLTYLPWIIYTPDSSYDSDWGMGDFEDFIPGATEGFGIIGNGNKPNSNGRLGIPRFSTLTMNEVKVSFIFSPTPLTAETRILAECNDGEAPLSLGNFPMEAGKSQVTFTLPDKMLDKPWVQLYIDSKFPTTSDFIGISEISIAGDHSSVENPETEKFTISSGKGYVQINGADLPAISVFTLSGIKTADVKAGMNNGKINLAPGAYILCIGTKSYKIIIK